VRSRPIAVVGHGWSRRCNGRHFSRAVAASHRARLLLIGVVGVVALWHLTKRLGLLRRGIVRCLLVGLKGLSEGLGLGLLQGAIRRTRRVALGERTRGPVYGSKVLGQDLDKIGGEDADGLVPPQPAGPPGPVSCV
jgi:hypothetical protein